MGAKKQQLIADGFTQVFYKGTSRNFTYWRNPEADWVVRVHNSTESNQAKKTDRYTANGELSGDEAAVRLIMDDEFRWK